MNSHDLEKLLAIRYSAPAYAFLKQVRNQTGFYNNSDGIRTADGLALSLFPSRGLHMHGFEIKTYKTDLMNELKHPEKADAIGKYCNYWWIVVPDKLTFSIEDLPDTWGLLVAEGNRLVAKKQAVFMKAKPIDLGILCGILRKVNETMISMDVFNDAVNEREKSLEKIVESRFERKLRDAENLNKKVEEFEKISGVKIDTWNLGEVAEAVGIIRAKKNGGFRSDIEYIRDRAKNIVKEANLALKEDNL
jgi:hypothetical protein